MASKGGSTREKKPFSLGSKIQGSRDNVGLILRSIGQIREILNLGIKAFFANENLFVFCLSRVKWTITGGTESSFPDN